MTKEYFKTALLLGSIACTGDAIASTNAVDVLDPNSVNLLVNAVLTIVMFILRMFPKKEKK